MNLGRIPVSAKKVEILHQPIENFSNLLLREVNLATPPFSIIRILSAYITVKGVEILRAILGKGYSKNHSIIAYVSIGIDRKRTSRATLQKLLELKGKYPNLHINIVNDMRAGYTFHIKMYNFESSNSASIFIGSSNLTKSGLSTNYEMMAFLEIDLSSTNKSYSSFQDSIKSYFPPSTNGWIKELTFDLIEKLDKEKMLAKDDDDDNAKNYAPQSKIFQKGKMKATKTNIVFSKPSAKKKSAKPKIGLQLTPWDTDPRHSEIQIPREVINSGFFPRDQLKLRFSKKIFKNAKLSHYPDHSRIYNKEILEQIYPKAGDVLILTRLSNNEFKVDLVKKAMIVRGLMRQLKQQKGKGKKWGWL